MADHHQHVVLVVEDDADTREAYQEMLEDRGHRVAVASNGREAVTALGQGLRPCVIVLDLAMPEMNGFDFRRAQLADEALAAIPVIVVSAGGYVNKYDARTLGMSVYLTKPVDIDHLDAALHRGCQQAGERLRGG